MFSGPRENFSEKNFRGKMSGKKIYGKNSWNFFPKKFFELEKKFFGKILEKFWGKFFWKKVFKRFSEKSFGEINFEKNFVHKLDGVYSWEYVL